MKTHEEVLAMFGYDGDRIAHREIAKTIASIRESMVAIARNREMLQAISFDLAKMVAMGIYAESDYDREIWLIEDRETIAYDSRELRNRVVRDICELARKMGNYHADPSGTDSLALFVAFESGVHEEDTLRRAEKAIARERGAFAMKNRHPRKVARVRRILAIDGSDAGQAHGSKGGVATGV